MSNDDLDEIMDDSFSFFAEELIKSIFDYQLGRIFNNKKELAWPSMNKKIVATIITTSNPKK